MDEQMEFVEFTTGGRQYIVTKPMATSIEALLQASEELTLRSYPEASPAVPLFLSRTGLHAIAVIKAYRDFTRERDGMPLNLKECKHIVVDRCRDRGERILLGHFPINKAEQIAEPFREAGATVSYPSPLVLLAQQALED